MLPAAAASAVPLLIGTNRDELYLFTALDGRSLSADDAELLAAVRPFVADDAEAADLIATYAASRPGATPGQLGAAITGDQSFWMPAIRLAESRSAPTWMYRFDWPTPTLGGLLGACHGVELPFVFETLDAARGFLGDDPALGELAADGARRVGPVRHRRHAGLGALRRRAPHDHALRPPVGAGRRPGWRSAIALEPMTRA